MKQRYQILGILALSYSTAGFSGGMGDISSWSQVLTLSAGPAWINNNKTQTFYLQPDIQKTYAAGKKNNSLGMAEFFLGWQKPFRSIFMGQLGLAVGTTTNAELNGDIWEDADPAFNNFYYNYTVNHTRLALKGKLLADYGIMFTPYLSASLGIGWNRASDFTITPKIFEEVPAPAFTSQTATALSYTLGIGLAKTLSAHCQASVGYEFADLGQSQLGLAPGQTVNNGLHQPQLYTNGIQFSLSYIA